MSVDATDRTACTSLLATAASLGEQNSTAKAFAAKVIAGQSAEITTMQILQGK